MKEKIKNQTPAACPSREEVSKAVGVLWDQQLHYYQLLYFKGLTDPYGIPYKVSRDSICESNNPTDCLNISRQNHPEYTFFVPNGTKDEYIMKNIELIENAIKKGLKKEHNLACCPLAKQVQCVCVASFDCPIHGRFCIGSHD